MKRILILIHGILTVPFSLSSLAFAANPPVTITVEPKNTVVLSAYGIPPIYKEGRDTVSARVEGQEKSECKDYGHRGVATANADVRVLHQENYSLSLSLSTNTLAKGGHYRTCGQCIASTCVIIQGNNTNASAAATASARVTLAFDDSGAPGEYLLDVTTSVKDATPIIRLTDQAGRHIDLRTPENGPALITGGPGSRYYLWVELSNSSEGVPWCCDQLKMATAQLDLRLRKAPILASKGDLIPYIRGGKPTESYEFVGAILLDGQLHCTATIIGKRTLLTAAHCLFGYEDQIDDFIFILGPNIIQTTESPFRITKFEYPQDETSGYLYNPRTYQDDIGIVYVDNVLPDSPVILHSGKPVWKKILDESQPLTFVGYGYDVVKSRKVADGVKREASWKISEIENRRVAFKVPKLSTCKGDSGGGAFLFVDDEFILVAVTSLGDMECTIGYETRVDTYQAWLTPRIH
jgi:secreted trypsin-like serine protease